MWYNITRDNTDKNTDERSNNTNETFSESERLWVWQSDYFSHNFLATCFNTYFQKLDNFCEKP